MPGSCKMFGEQSDHISSHGSWHNVTCALTGHTQQAAVGIERHDSQSGGELGTSWER